MEPIVLDPTTDYDGDGDRPITTPALAGDPWVMDLLRYAVGFERDGARVGPGLEQYLKRKTVGTADVAAALGITQRDACTLAGLWATPVVRRTHIAVLGLPAIKWRGRWRFPKANIALMRS